MIGSLIVSVVSYGLGVVTGVSLSEHELLTMADLKAGASAIISKGKTVATKANTSGKQQNNQTQNP
jgi:hypothetical protein